MLYFNFKPTATPMGAHIGIKSAVTVGGYRPDESLKIATKRNNFMR